MAEVNNFTPLPEESPQKGRRKAVDIVCIVLAVLFALALVSALVVLIVNRSRENDDFVDVFDYSFYVEYTGDNVVYMENDGIILGYSYATPVEFDIKLLNETFTDCDFSEFSVSVLNNVSSRSEMNFDVSAGLAGSQTDYWFSDFEDFTVCFTPNGSKTVTVSSDGTFKLLFHYTTLEAVLNEYLKVYVNSHFGMTSDYPVFDFGDDWLGEHTLSGTQWFYIHIEAPDGTYMDIPFTVIIKYSSMEGFGDGYGNIPGDWVGVGDGGGSDSSSMGDEGSGDSGSGSGSSGSDDSSSGGGYVPPPEDDPDDGDDDSGDSGFTSPDDDPDAPDDDPDDQGYTPPEDDPDDGEDDPDDTGDVPPDDDPVDPDDDPDDPGYVPPEDDPDDDEDPDNDDDDLSGGVDFGDGHIIF